MTSWNRGVENEREGEREQQQGAATGDVGQQLRGAAREAAGNIEQGVDNVVDTLGGRQNDLEGNQHNYGRDVQNAVNNAGDDLRHAADDAGHNLNQGLNDLGRSVDRAANQAGDWVQDRANDLDRRS